MQHIIIMGVSGSGKSTLAALLRERLDWPFAEADEFHPKANIDKMSRGEPLNDNDRWPWLEALRGWMTEQDAAGRNSLCTCSALKRSYRDLLRGAEGEVVFVLLQGGREVLEERMATRSGHFMPTTLLDSQLATLELPDADENILVLDINQPPEQLAEAVTNRLIQTR